MKYNNFNFVIKKNDLNTSARLGYLSTPHGNIETPNFVFCATKATLKGVTVEQAKNAGTSILLCNTYHLFLQPGIDVIEKHGGLHNMLNWDGPIFTDSGGFQIFSFGYGGVTEEIKKNSKNHNYKSLVKIDDLGAMFRSYINGKYYYLTPEISIELQCKMKSDICFVLDECTPFNISKEYTQKSTQRSINWSKKSMESFITKSQGNQALYGIVQGGIYKEFREESSKFVSSMPFFGQAVGGTLGNNRKQMIEIINFSLKYLPKNKPVHLLGIGGLLDIWESIMEGIDTFDCVYPTRIARHGCILVRPKDNNNKEFINLKNSSFKNDFNYLDKYNLNCYSSKYTNSYINHLLKSNESVAGTLISIYNIAFMNKMFEDIRKSILNNTLFLEFYKYFGYEYKK